MNGFDFALLAIVALSTLFAFVRGVIRELIALTTWVVGFILAIQYSAAAARLFSWLDVAPAVRYVLAFGLILIVAMLVGAAIATMMSGAVRAVGLGFVDRLLGAAFGVARGLVAVVAFALIAGVTSLPKHDWWQNSILGRPLATAALALQPYLPRAWARRLDFSPAGTVSACAGASLVDARVGEHESCVGS